MSTRTPTRDDATTPARRRVGRRAALVIAGGAIAAAALLSGCGGKGSSSSTTTTTQAATSTTRAATSSTTAAGATTTTLKPTATPTGMDPWAVGPNDFSGVVGSRYSYVCPANGDASFSLWGTGPFTDDSSICVAATYAGLITAARGGTVTIDVQTGASSYAGGVSNGITAMDYGPWPTQFVFVR